MPAPRIVLWLAVSSAEQARDDKTSLDMQERLGRAYIEANGGRLVQMFRWDGFTRSNPDPIDALEEFAREGRYDYHQLRDLWRSRAFDVLWMYVYDRGGRSFTLASWVIENVIASGAEVFIHNIGAVNATNYASVIALGGMQAVTSVQRLVDGRRATLLQFAEHGLPIPGGLKFTHTLVRKANGTRSHIELNPDALPLMNDAATLILRGVAWGKLDRALHEEFGHPLAYGGRMYLAFTNPLTWGHVAVGAKFGGRTGKQQRQHAGYGLWRFEEGHPLPPHVQVFYNIVPAVYTGELAAALIQAYKHRQDIAIGKASAATAKRYTGLVVCGECLHTMASKRYMDRDVLKCISRWQASNVRTPCTQTKAIRYEVIDRWLDTRLREWLAAQDDSIFDTDTPPTSSPRAEDTVREISRLETLLRGLIRDRAAVSDDSLLALYAGEMETANRRLARLRKDLAAQEQHQQAEAGALKEQARLRGDLRAMTLDRFWQQSPATVNRILHGVFRNRVIVVADGAIIGTMERRKHHRKQQTPSE